MKIQNLLTFEYILAVAMITACIAGLYLTGCLYCVGMAVLLFWAISCFMLLVAVAIIYISGYINEHKDNNYPAI